MSQHDAMEQLQLLIRQQAKQLVAGLGEIERGVEKVALKPKYEFQPEIAEPLLFDGDLGKVAGFVIVCKLYIQIRIKVKIFVTILSIAKKVGLLVGTNRIYSNRGNK